MASERGGDPLDFEIFSTKGCFFSFKWEKTNFTTFGPPGKIFEKFLMAFHEKIPSSYYNVLPSTAIVLNNFILWRHCEIVQLFRSTPFLTKALTTIISKHFVYPCVGFSN